jgi:hypothetical protein
MEIFYGKLASEHQRYEYFKLEENNKKKAFQVLFLLYIRVGQTFCSRAKLKQVIVPRTTQKSHQIFFAYFSHASAKKINSFS